MYDMKICISFFAGLVFVISGLKPENFFQIQFVFSQLRACQSQLKMGLSGQRY